MKRVLFVDDEPNILQGLQRMLRPERNEWEMHFAHSGIEALGLLENAPYDTIVTDMRIPGMDGEELLKEVAQRYPTMVRIVLSGYSGDKNILRSIENSHQFLAKPCDADTMIATLRRAAWLQDYLNNPFLQRLTANVSSIPSHPSLYYEIVLMLEKPDVTIKDIVQKMSSDIGMTAKILQLVNSAYFGNGRHITSLLQAINMIGLNTVKSLVLSLHVFSYFNDMRLKRASVTNLWNHSLQTAKVAERIARMEGLENGMVDETYTASMLHDVGTLILLNRLPEEYEPILMNETLPDIPLEEAEEAFFGSTHAEVGAYLMGLWGLPDSMMQTIAFHHAPGKQSSRELNSLAIVHAANALVSEMDHTIPRSPMVRLDEQYIAETGIQRNLDAWRKHCMNPA